MRLFRRALAGLMITAVTAGLLGVGGWRIYDAISNVEKSSRGKQRERSYVVDTGTLTPQTYSPVITAYGQVQAWTSLEIRAPAAGPITEISANLRDGLAVAKGELLFRIDPEIASRRVTDAKAALEQAETELSEARQSLKHMESEVSAAKAQADVRRNDLQRKQTLFAKKLVTASALDEVRLAVSAADQAVIAKEQALVAAQSRIEKAVAGVNRGQITLSDTERSLQDTAYRAPFAGRLADVTLTMGRRISQNEKLALLIDPAALEVSFPVRNSDFGHLIDQSRPDQLAALPIKAKLDLSGNDIVVEGQLDRPAAVASTQAGRTLYARLTGSNAAALRPGDFVTVTVTEPPLDQVAVIPADAATVDGNVLLVGDDQRLSEHASRILRRQADTLVVSDVPFGATYVRRRLPFLAAGIKVKARQTQAPGSDRDPGPDSSAGPVARGPGKIAAEKPEDGITLDEPRRAALIAHVKADTSLPEPRRVRMLEELAKSTPSRRIVDRIEKRMVRLEQRS